MQVIQKSEIWSLNLIKLVLHNTKLMQYYGNTNTASKECG